MSAHHLAFDVAYAHIGASSPEEVLRRREDIIASAAIRAMLYAVRGLPPATGCAAAHGATALCTSSCDRSPSAVSALSNAARDCPCVPGMCRGGEVINGLLANGARCRGSAPAVAWLASEDTESSAL